jgi:DNA polymerase-1
LADQPEKLFLIDAMSLVFRAFFAPMQMALASPAGMPTKAIYIFVRILMKLIKEQQPHHAAVAFDLSAPTFRDKLMETYKANRQPFPEDLAPQLPYIRRFCPALGLRIVEKEGFEADDIIGTLARQAERQGLDVVIVSGDEDLFQLVGERIRVLKPGRNAQDSATLVDAEKVREIIGVPPAQVIDWLALTGDPSDNIPGARPLPGQEPALPEGAKKRSYIGPKGATELMNKYGSLQNALDGWEQEQKKSYREALRDFRNEALLSRDLATIRTDVPLDVAPGGLRLGSRNLPELVALCQELGFTSLMREFLAETDSAAAAAGAAAAPQNESAEEVARWLKALEPGRELALGYEYRGEEGYGAELTALGFSDGERVLQLAAGPEAARAVREALADWDRPKMVHNAKLLELLLGKHNVPLRGVRDDILLYSYLTEPLVASHTLADATLRHLGRRLDPAGAEAAAAVRQLALLLRPRMESEGLRRVYEEIELPLAPVLAAMERAGIALDTTILQELSHEFEKSLALLTSEIYGLAGEPFDIDSPKQLGEILFGKLQMPGGKRLKKSGQYSTGAEVLEALAQSQPLARKVLDYRTRAKLKSTYVDSLPRFLNPATGRLHSTFNQAGSRTGRLSSINPNLQNIPVSDEYGQLIRSAFVAPTGCRLMAADYSQIELRVLAELSADPVLVEAFARGEDIHSRTAQEIFGVLPGLQTHEHRRMAKAINYGVIYGLSAFGLAQRTGATNSEAQHYIDEYFRRYARVKQYLDARVEEARQTGRVVTLFGRMRPIPEIQSPDPAARNRAAREAMNTPLQGTAADLLKLAMIRVQSNLAARGMTTRMILTVHDELVFEAPEAELEAAQQLVRRSMEGAYPMRVPLTVDVGVGHNWAEAK